MSNSQKQRGYGSIIMPCAQCGAGFSAPVHRVVREGRRYCSPACNYTAKRGTPLQTFNRFAKKSNDPQMCWLWTGAVNQRGYGLMLVWQGATKERDTAHRFSYKTYVGPIPPGMFVCHTCDNPSCCNPGHLFLGTAAENVADMHAKGRWPAKLTADELAEIRASAAPSRELGRKFGVTYQHILRIKRGISWRINP